MKGKNDMKRRALTLGVMILPLFLAFALLGLFGCMSGFTDLCDYVDPFAGTAGTGHTFPGACVPFGMIQAGPDTGNGDWAHCSGYVYGDTNLYGFSQTHLNGTGCADLGDIRLLPFTSEDVPEFLPMDKATERASPGSYAVTAGGVKVEVTATDYVARYRITYPKGAKRRLLVDAQWGLRSWGDASNRVLRANTYLYEKRGLAGELSVKQWNPRRIGFAVRFGEDFASAAELPCKPGEKAPRYLIDFGGESAVLTVDVALASDVPMSSKTLGLRARRHLETCANEDFTASRRKARTDWEAIFQRAVIEGTDEQKRNWYTSLYHLCVQPNKISDARCENPFYSTFSTWDTFRAAGPLYTILMPDKAAEFVDSMLAQGEETGYLPIWALWGEENQCMIGTHSVPVIVDWFLKSGEAVSRPLQNKEGASSVTSGQETASPLSASPLYWESAYAQIKETLTQRHEGRKKENWDLYDRYGYYPFDAIRGESVSRTLECAYDDWCAAQMAEKLGHKEDAAFFLKRSAYWKNVYDPTIGFVRGRDAKGNWRKPFDPFALGHGANLANDFTEGNAFQYSWHVMQDVPGLVAAMGGREKFVARLDSLFEAPSKTEGMGELVDVTGLIGQYVHGNEPSHHVIYFYPLLGEPDKAAERIREVFDRFYLPKPDGLCGNDDCGQMSAWYLFSAMGFYPFNPCGGEYVLGAPQVEKVTLHCSPSPSTFTSFTVMAKNLSKECKYVKSVTLNGKPITNWRISHADIVKGGELVFEMTDRRK